MPDGKIWVGGEFTKVGSVNVRNLASLQWDGNPAKSALLEPNGTVRCLLPAEDNSVWVGGAFTEVSGVRRMGIARVVENDGSRLDLDFAPVVEGEVRCLLADGDGVLAGGSFTRVNGRSRAGVVRLLADGSVDPAFDAKLEGEQGIAVNAMARQPDGKILLAGLFDRAGTQAVANLVRLYPGGALDSVFLGSADGEVHALGVQADSRIVIGGDFLNASGNSAAKLARLDRNGLFNKTINGLTDRVNTIAIQPDGKVVVGGRFGRVGGALYGNLARFSSDLLIEKPDPIAQGEVYCCLPQSDGHLLVGGSFSRIDLQSRPKLARLDGNLRTDVTLGSNTGVIGSINTIVQQSDEKLLFAGPFSSFGNYQGNGLVRTDSNGLVDTAFLRPILVGGLTGVQVRRDQRLYVFGNLTRVNETPRAGIARLLSTGALDPEFNASVTGTTAVSVNAIADQAGNALWLGGNFTHIKDQPRAMIGGVSNSGSLFNSNITPAVSGAPTELLAFANELVLAGVGDAAGQTANRVFTRSYTSRGLNANFLSPVGGKVNGMCRLPDGKILVWGLNPLGTKGNLCRILPGGHVDATFDPFFKDEVYSVSVQADGSMLVLGKFTNYIGGNVGRAIHDGFVHVMPDLRPGGATGVASMSSPGLARSGMVQADGKFLFWGSFTYAKGERPGLARISTIVPAAQELGIVESGTGFKIVWQRGGSAPQVERVWLSASTNGTNYGAASEAVWMNGRWESGVFNLPAKTRVWIRAEGRVPSNNGGDAGGLVQSTRQIFLEGEVDVAMNEKSLISGDGSEVDFGSRVQGSSAVSRTFTITNRGNDWLELGEPVVPDGFSAGPLSANQLAPGEQATLDVTTDLSRAGTWTGELVIPSDDLDEPGFVISLKTGVLNPLRTTVLKPRAVPNRKTGLREQTVRVRNAAGVTLPAFRVIVRGLPPGVEIRNASEQLPDGSYVFVVTQPLGPFASTDLKIEYFFPKKTSSKITPRISTEVILNPE
jgi:uncharacterized delta-60 repeat protein